MARISGPARSSLAMSTGPPSLTRLAAHRFARARFADQGQGAAGRDRERDVVDGPQGALVNAELDGQVLDAQQILHTVAS
jgi:hypothetical protein